MSNSIIIDVLYSFKTDEQVKPIQWLINSLEQKGAVFVGNKTKAQEVGFPEEWSDIFGGFWVLDKTKDQGYYSLVGPGDLEEILEDLNG